MVLLVAAACGGGAEPEHSGQVASSDSFATLSLTSTAFAEGDTVPTEFTCEGDDTSPPLEWSGVPEDAAELRLTLTDFDVPGGTFRHWLVTGIDPSATGVEAGAVPEGGTEEQNSFGETAYGGPCPPSGPAHMYIWGLEALAGDGQVLAMGLLSAEFGT